MDDKPRIEAVTMEQNQGKCEEKGLEDPARTCHVLHGRAGQSQPNQATARFGMDVQGFSTSVHLSQYVRAINCTVVQLAWPNLSYCPNLHVHA